MSIYDYEGYEYAIAQLNVSKAHLAIAIDKWETEILKNGIDEHSDNFLKEAKGKFNEIDKAINRLRKSNYDIIEDCGICPHCKIPLKQCQSDHK